MYGAARFPAIHQPFGKRPVHPPDKTAPPRQVPARAGGGWWCWSGRWAGRVGGDAVFQAESHPRKGSISSNNAGRAAFEIALSLFPAAMLFHITPGRKRSATVSECRSPGSNFGCLKSSSIWHKSPDDNSPQRFHRAFKSQLRRQRRLCGGGTFSPKIKPCNSPPRIEDCNRVIPGMPRFAAGPAGGEYVDLKRASFTAIDIDDGALSNSSRLMKQGM